MEKKEIELLRAWIKVYYASDISLVQFLITLREMMNEKLLPPILEIIKHPLEFVKNVHVWNFALSLHSTILTAYPVLKHLKIKNDEAFMLAIKLAHHTQPQILGILKETMQFPLENVIARGASNSQEGAPRPRSPAPDRDNGNNNKPGPSRPMGLERSRPASPAAPRPRPASPASPAAPRPRPTLPPVRGDALKKLERALGAGITVKLYEGAEFTQLKDAWKNGNKFLADMASLGNNRANGFCDDMRDDIQGFLKKQKNKPRYMVLVYKNNAAVSVLLCTLHTAVGAAKRHVVVEFICTKKSHGVPLMKFVEDDAKERGLRYVKLASVLSAVHFYERQLQYVRSVNPWNKPLRDVEIKEAEKAWEKLENEKKKSAETAATTLLETKRKTKVIKDQARQTRALYNTRFAPNLRNGWRGKKPDGTFMYEKPVYFKHNKLESNYKLPVLSKRLY